MFSFSPRFRRLEFLKLSQPKFSTRFAAFGIATVVPCSFFVLSFSGKPNRLVSNFCSSEFWNLGFRRMPLLLPTEHICWFVFHSSGSDYLNFFMKLFFGRWRLFIRSSTTSTLNSRCVAVFILLIDWVSADC